MNDQISTERAERVDKFLLEDYGKWAESMYRSEETGEKRINYFVSLASAVLAGVAALLTAKESAVRPELLPAVTIGALSGLLVLGWVTFLRMLHRNKVTDRCKRQMASIREHFLAGSGLSLSIGESFLGPRKLRQGGLAVMMLVMNTFITGLLAYAIAYDQAWRELWAVGAALVAFLTQNFLIKRPGWGIDKSS